MLGMDRISEILKRAREKFPQLSKRISEASALVCWEEAVGPGIAKHTRAICVKDGVLWVVVDHPIWKSELHYRKRQILELLNKMSDGKSAKSEIIQDLLLLSPRERF